MLITSSGLKPTQHRFSHHPESPVKLHISVDTTHGAGMRSPAFRTPATEPALNQVLLNTLICGPQIIALILPAAWGEYLRCCHWLVVLTETVRQCSLCQSLLCRWRQHQRLHGIPLLFHTVKNTQHFIRPLNHLTHDTSFVRHTHLAKRLTADKPVLAYRAE